MRSSKNGNFLATLPFVTLLCTFLISVAGCGGTATTSGTSTPPVTTPTGVNNSAAITAGGGPTGMVDGLYTSVTLCSPGTSDCATINSVLVDTGSTGLRILSSALPSGFSLPQQSDSNNNPIGECFPFVSGSTWGPVHTTDMEIAGEKASSFPMQIIGAENFANIPTSCSSNGPTMQSLADLGANGILGVGNFKQDCGPACAAESSLGIYFTCPSSGCQEIAQPLTSQLQNPVSLFTTDNNGVLIELPSVAAGGAASVNGELIFGIGTQSNNALGSATVLTLNDYGDFTTSFQGKTYTNSFVDTGSNGLFFLNTAATGIPVCSDATFFYCPTATDNLSATNQGQNGSSTAINLSVENADSLLSSSGPNFLFNDLAGPGAGSFDWGLPFFLGRNVFVGFEQENISGNAGPFAAY
jgi:Protein of unknown function (DUF3443)